MNGFAIVPPANGEGFVELSRTKKGRLFEKHILNYGDLLYPGVKGGKVTINDEWADKLITNFSNKVCDIVQVPKAGPNNEHTEDPDRNIGEVVGLNKRDGKIYAQIDARDSEAAEKLGKTLLGASAMLHLNYKDTRTGAQVGPTLLHVAVTNRPYVTELEDYEELLAASADGTSDAVFLTAPDVEEDPMTLDEILLTLKNEHSIDVVALQEKAANIDAAVALSNQIQDQLVGTGLLKLTNGEAPTAEDLLGAVSSAGEQIVGLTSKVDDLTKAAATKDAETRVDGLVRSGHILPKNRDANVTLLLSNSDLFESLLPEKPIVKLSNASAEQGVETIEDDHEKTVTDEVARLSASPVLAKSVRAPKA